MSDPVKICNAVAVMIGADPVQSLNDDTDLSRIFSNLYDFKKRAIMSKYAWRFLIESVYLTRLSSPPMRGWKYSYVIPGEALAGAPHAVFFYQGQKLGSHLYAISGNKVLSDQPELWAELVVDRKESEWPAYFQELVTHAMAAVTAYPVTDQASLAQMHDQIAFGTPSEGGVGGLMGSAMLLDSQSDGNTGIESDYFVNARRGAW